MSEIDLDLLADKISKRIVDPKEWMTPKDLHEEFGILPSTQNNLRSNKDIPFYKRGRYIRYKRSEIIAWFEAGKVV